MLRRRAITIGVLFLIALIGGGASYGVFTSEKAALRADAEYGLQTTSKTFVNELTRLFVPATRTIGSIQDANLHRLRFGDMARVFLGIATGSVRQLDQVTGIYLGFPDGRFVHIQDIVPKPLENEAGLAAMQTVLVRRIITDHRSDPQGIYQYRETAGDPWQLAETRPQSYDPRERPWYKAAVGAGEAVWTEPYTFASTGELGATYAVPLFDAAGRLWAVAGIDLSLQALSSILLDTLERSSTQDDLIFATDFARQVIGHPDFTGGLSDEVGDNDVSRLLSAYSQPESLEYQLTGAVGQPNEVNTVLIEGEEFLTIRRDLSDGRAMPMSIFMARDLDQILADAEDTLTRNVLMLFCALFVFGAVSAYAAKLKVEVALRKRLQRELIDAKNVAEAATKAKSTFLATMSHEIRTPMNGVMSMAELLNLTRLSGEQRNMTQIILGSANSLLTIINDILDFSKIEAGKLDIESIGFSLRDTVYGTGELLVAKSDEKGIGLVVHVDPSLADHRQGDPTRIRQILLNLAGNAVKFTDSGEVQVLVKPSAIGAERIRFEIKDTGIGLTEEQLGKLFKPFQQADQSTSRKYGGTGLGLSICQRLTELMGGEIGVASVYGEGSTFWFDLPLTAEEDDAEEGQDPAFADLKVAFLGLGETAAWAARETLLSLGAQISEAGVTGPGDKQVVLADPSQADLAELDLSSDATVAVVQTRSQSFAASELPFRPHLKLTYPLGHGDLRRVLRVAAGLEDPDAEESVDRADMQFEAPDLDTARSARALILVAEDNVTNQIVIRQMLGRLGYACEIAQNGREALEMLDRESHGLLLSDFNMPEMDGFELTKAIRAQPADQADRLPVVALTADAMSGTQEACEAAGMDAYLTKPVDSVALRKALEAYMPQGMDLRVAQNEEAAPDAGDDDLPFNPDVFDADRLIESFGALDRDALAFAANFASDAEAMVSRFADAADAGDGPGARHEIHAIKGAAKSVGAVQMGQIASDLQDMIDDGNVEMAAMLSDGLRDAQRAFAEHIAAHIRT